MDRSTQRSSSKKKKDAIYLPAIPKKASSPASIRGRLSQSCPYLNHSLRSSSFSLFHGGGHARKQSYLSAKREAKKSNVGVTVTYLGRGSPTRSSPDDLKVLQQVNGGENLCVFRGSVTPGEQFHFVSQRHRGFPFSASLFVNGIRAARLSSCCEYRYTAGLRQGQGARFRLTRLAGGVPCDRCTSLGNERGRCQEVNGNTKEGLVLPLIRHSGNDPQVESCPSSPLFIPIKPETSPSGRAEDGDGEGPPAASGRKRRCRGRARRRGEDKHEMSASSGSARGSGGSPKDEGPASSGSRERKKDETGNVLEGRRLQRRVLSNPKDPDSDVEPGEESERGGEPDKDKEVVEEEPLHQHDLRAQLEAVNAVLGVSDEVEQLVLRNAELTDELLATVVAALKSSPSRVALLNLNLNLIGPDGAHVLLDLLRVKPQVQALHLFGNRLCDHGAIALLSGMVELQEQKSRAAPLATIPQPGSPRPPGAPPAALAITPFSLSELDIGGNGLSGNGVKALASYMRRSRLRYLGLARTAGADLAAWKELFDSLKGNDSLSELILDENDLGDPGVRLLADVLKVNAGLRRVDLDANGIGDVGGNELVAALLSRGRRPLRRLSLARNRIGSGLMRRIREELDPQ